MPRPTDLPSARQLSRKHRHGHKMKYMAGCRCWRCRAGNAAYDTLPLHERIPAGETLEKINQLIKWGYSRRLINSDAMGAHGFGLQIRSLKGTYCKVTVKTTRKIRDFFASIEAIRDMWQRKRGAIPNRQFVYWKKGKHGSDSILDLELIPFPVTYDYHNLYPSELKEAMRLRNKLKRSITNRRGGNHGQKHNARSK